MALILAVDDATGTVPYILFREQEDTSGYFMLIKGVVKRRGIPMAIHTDRHAVFDTNRAKNLPDNPNRRQTQFSRAPRQLGILLILARSPQAKGRVERMAGIFQDRLISELRLANAVMIEDANHFLNEFLPKYNQPPPENMDYRQLPVITFLEKWPMTTQSGVSGVFYSCCRILFNVVMLVFELS